MASGQITNRVGTGGNVLSTTSGINNTTSQDLTAGKFFNNDVVNFTETPTPKVGTITVTVVGAEGDEVALGVSNGTTKVSLGTYVVLLAHTTPTLSAAGIVSIVNAGTGTHGFSATNTAGVVSVTGPATTGILYQFSNNITGTIAITKGAFVGYNSAVASSIALASVGTQGEKSVYSLGNMLQRTKNRLKFLGRTL